MYPHHRVWIKHHGYGPDWKNKREIIHHVDGNKKNNLIENLRLMTQSEHIKLHQPRCIKHSEATKKKLSAQRMGNQHRKGIPHSEKVKKKIGFASLKVWQRPEMKSFISARKRTKRGTFK